MRVLDFSTVETLIFEDEATHALFPAHCMSHFEMWKLARRMPMLRQAGRAAVLDLLNGITDDTVGKLEGYFGERILLHRLHYDIVRDVKIPLGEADEVCRHLCEIEGFDNFTTWRDAEFLYVCFWR